MRHQYLSGLLRLWKRKERSQDSEGSEDTRAEKNQPNYEEVEQQNKLDIAHHTGINDLPIEILQQIFSSLDFRTLYTCHSVCHLWYKYIPGHSPRLRSALFLPSSTTSSLKAPPVTLNFIIHCRNTKRSKGYINLIDRICFQSLSSSNENEIVLNPFVQGIEQYISVVSPNVNARSTLHSFRFTALKDKSGTRWHPLNVKCVKNTFLTTPPATRVQVHFQYSVWGSFVRPWGAVQDASLYDENGVKFMDLFEVFEKQVAGLLRKNVLRKIDNAPGHASCSDLYAFRKRIASAVSPV
ncbi:Nn.00g080430.m01.CDS01 [Neocucurbitaria sp. VM-36]